MQLYHPDRKPEPGIRGGIGSASVGGKEAVTLIRLSKAYAFGVAFGWLFGSSPKCTMMKPDSTMVVVIFAESSCAWIGFKYTTHLRIISS
jgi:hypothetical protein